MLWVGLTGGIGAGKSAVTREFQRFGAAVVDADVLAREVVEPGTPGLAAVVDAFGTEILTGDGKLDRPALGRLVFADADARARLNAIVHPLIGARTAELVGHAEAAGHRVLVHDVPLLAENGLAPAYHLVVVVTAPLDVRMHRLTRLRGMPESEARDRIAAQASDEQRASVADEVLDNSRSLGDLRGLVRNLWEQRVSPYADNLAERRCAPRDGVELAPPDPAWQRRGERLVERLRFVCGARAERVEHVGSTAVPGLAAKPVLDLQVEAASREVAAELEPVLAAAGFPPRPDVDSDPVQAELDADAGQYWKRLHCNADPAQAVNVHVRVQGTTAARAARALRDELRRDDALRAGYEQEKRRLAAVHADDTEAYAEGKTRFLLPVLVRVTRPEATEP